MDGGAQPSPTLLEGFGLFRIWSTLILTPILVIVLVVAMFVVAGWQHGWTRSMATKVQPNPPACQPLQTGADMTSYSCTATVKVATLPDKEFQLHFQSEMPSSTQDQWDVIYDPANPEGTITTSVMTPHIRTEIQVALGVFTALSVAFFVVDVVFRNNRTWQNIQGAAEGIELTSRAFS